MSNAELIYSVSTDGKVLDLRPEPVVPTVQWMVEEPDPHCFVCQRHTDHFAEHDDMVEAGTARYGSDGSVYPVPWAWD